jgi:integrase
MPTVRQLVASYLSATARNQCSCVLAERRRLLDLFCAGFGDACAVSIRKFQVVDWINAHPAWKSDWTVKRVLGTLQTVFRWGARVDLIERNPIVGLSHRAGERGRPWDLAEFQALMRASTPIFRRVLVFLRFSGARPGEMSGLQWAMIQPERRCIMLMRHKTARSRADRAPRVIALHPVLVKLLVWICQRQPPDEKFVFLNHRGKHWDKNSLGLRIYRIRKKIGLPLSVKLYGARHLFGTQCILKGVDLMVLAELMGHASTKMTEYYVHLAGRTDHLQSALGKAFG